MTSSTFRDDDQRAVRFYTNLLEQHGVDPRSLDWGSANSQNLRFSIITQMGIKAGVSLLDVGCGLGDYYGWLRERSIILDYHGIDLTPPMIQRARERFPRGNFEVGNLMEMECHPVDYVTASGIFYLRRDEPERFLQAMVARMFEVCRIGVAFNSLSEWAPQKEEGEYYADPFNIVKYCRTLTPWVTLRHDYHKRDFTVYLYREAMSS